MSEPDASLGYIVRHGVTRAVGIFAPPPGMLFSRGDHVIIRTERGVEIGDLLCPATAPVIERLPDPTRGEILRNMTPEDHGKADELKTRMAREFDAAREAVARRHLPMEFVEIERLFGGERVVFYFLSEKRVDFRDLVKELAREFQSRIELRQIGVRDEAKLKADYGDCGKPVCCNTHMIVMPPVSMKMAKLQKSTLDPTKISGRCGRLKCCLRFEQDVYEEFQRELPPVGSRIVTAKGPGRVLAQEVLARRLLVEFEDGRRVPVPNTDVLSRI
ncbi:MAG: stage 0 sporulation family protein [Gemmataceae bacterium]